MAMSIATVLEKLWMKVVGIESVVNSHPPRLDPLRPVVLFYLSLVGIVGDDHDYCYCVR